MQKDRAGGRAGGREVRRSVAVHRERLRLVGLGGVDRGVGGGVDDDVGTGFPDGRRHGGRVGHVELRACQRTHIRAGGREIRHQLPAQHAGRADHQPAVATGRRA